MSIFIKTINNLAKINPDSQIDRRLYINNYETFKGKCRRHNEFMYYNEWLTEQNDYNNKEA